MVRRLHIGGRVRTDGWEVLDANPGPCVDHVGDARDLSRFSENTFDWIYASHVLEHFDYKVALSAALKEWYRVLEPCGTLYLSVPDLDVLAGLLLAKDRLTLAERFFVMRMIFGGHEDRFDYHASGLNEEFLRVFLRDCGFVNVRRVAAFGLFDDTSSMSFKGTAISLNVIAEKPAASPGR